jgi:isopentenyl-diphosphate delta-isomerase
MDRVKEDELILVDLFDREIGTGPKLRVHRENRLHRAFSVFILHEDRMLIQRRAFDKYHSGGLWANACCSHPRAGEDLAGAVKRRLFEELGICTETEELFDFVYFQQYEGLSEYEYDHVFAGDYDGPLQVNTDEIHEVRWVPMEELMEDLLVSPEKYCAWFRIAFPKVAAWWKKKQEAKGLQA